MSQVQIRAALGAEEHQLFVRVPFLIGRNEPIWLTRLISDNLSSLHNPLLKHSEFVSLLAFVNDRAVGRIFAFLDKRAQNSVGYFCWLCAIDDTHVVKALLRAVKVWLKQRKRSILRGPVMPSVFLMGGLMTKGFDSGDITGIERGSRTFNRIVDSTALAYPFEARDFDVWRVGRNAIPRFAENISKAILSDPRVKLIPLQRHNFQDSVEIITEVYNQSWSHQWNFEAATTQDIKWLLKGGANVDLELSYVLTLDGKPVGVSISAPNFKDNQLRANQDALRTLLLNKAAKRSASWLYETRLKIGPRPKSWRIQLLGLTPQTLDSPYKSLLIHLLVHTTRRAKSLGYQYGEIGWTSHAQTPLKSSLSLIGATPVKTLRFYEAPA